MWFEERFVFRPVKAARCWNPVPDAAVEDVFFDSADGTRLHGWWLGTGRENGAVLFCHGIGGNLSPRGRTLMRFSALLGRAVFMFDYPGYGKSGGRPSERGCYAAGEGAYRWLRDGAGVPAGRIVLYGESAGGGVAVELATRLPHRALVLMKTFTSLPDSAALLYPWFPVRRWLRTRFDNLAKIGRCRAPVLIASGTEDRVTPLSQGRRLFDAAPEPKRFVELTGSDHNAFVPDGFLEEARRFLDDPEGRGPPPE